MTSTKTIAVFGATGAQGGGVVAALENRGGFSSERLHETLQPTKAPPTKSSPRISLIDRRTQT